MNDIMLDLETLGNGNRAVIVQIGACYFDRDTGEIGEEFFVKVDANSCVRAGLEMDPSTVYWWLSQSEEARKSLIEGQTYDLKDSIESFDRFVKSHHDQVWSHATFDFVILMNAYRAVNFSPKSRYSAARDIRTLVDLSGGWRKDYVRKGTHHNALDDCKYQVEYCVDMLNRLKQAF